MSATRELKSFQCSGCGRQRVSPASVLTDGSPIGTKTARWNDDAYELALFKRERRVRRKVKNRRLPLSFQRVDRDTCGTDRTHRCGNAHVVTSCLCVGCLRSTAVPRSAGCACSRCC